MGSTHEALQILEILAIPYTENHRKKSKIQNYLANKDRPWKYQDLADAMKEIVSEDECNDTYGRIRM